MKSIILFTLFIVNLFKISSMFITINPKNTQCLSQIKQKSDNLNIIYYISGEEEKKNNARILDPDNKKLWETPGLTSSTFNVVAQKTGKYSFCVDNNSEKPLTVTFEFSENNPEKEMITISTIDNLNSALNDVSKKLDVMQFGIRNGAVRREKHSEITRSIQSKITWYTWLKVIFLVLFSVFQIMMVTSIFKNVKIVTKIEMGNKGNRDNSQETTEFL